MTSSIEVIDDDDEVDERMNSSESEESEDNVEAKVLDCQETLMDILVN